MTDNQKSLLVGGVIGIVESIGKWIDENRCGFFKRNFVFGEIARRFPFVPIKSHSLILLFLGHRNHSFERDQCPFFGFVVDRDFVDDVSCR